MLTTARALFAAGVWVLAAKFGFSGTNFDNVSATAWITGRPKAAVLPLPNK
jgi:hypothetical protein